MCVALPALRGEGGIGGGDVQGVRGSGSEHVLKGLVHTDGVLRIAGALGDLIGGIGADIAVELDIGGVDRVGRGLNQVDPGELCVLKIIEGRALHLHRRIGVIPIGQSQPALQAGDEREGLIGTPRLGDGLSRGVDLVGQIVRASVQGENSPIRGIDRHQPRAQSVRVPLRKIVDGIDGGVLILLLDRGDDVQAAGVDLLVGELALLLKLGAHHLEEIARGPRIGLGVLRDDGLGVGGGVVLILGDVAVLEHVAEHALPSLLGLIRADGRIPGARRGQDAGHQRRLGDGHLGGRVSEERVGGGVDAVGPAAEINRIEIRAQDLLLIHLPVDLDGHDGLLELAGI